MMSRKFKKRKYAFITHCRLSTLLSMMMMSCSLVTSTRILSMI